MCTEARDGAHIVEQRPKEDVGHSSLTDALGPDVVRVLEVGSWVAADREVQADREEQCAPEEGKETEDAGEPEDA